MRTDLIPSSLSVFGPERVIREIFLSRIELGVYGYKVFPKRYSERITESHLCTIFNLFAAEEFELFTPIKMVNTKLCRQLVAGFAATMAMTGAGFNFGWSSPSLTKLQAVDSDIPITSSEGSWIASVFTIGCAIGALISALLVDRCGRKWLLFSTIFPHVIGSVLIGAARNVWWFIVARLVAGVGTGIAFTVVPIYAGEIADDRIRGAISGMLDPVVNMSVVLTSCVGPWVSRTALAGLGVFLPLVFGIVFVWMPESPYYLLMRQKLDEAKLSLVWLRGKTHIAEDMKILQKSFESEQGNSGTVRKLLMLPGNRKALVIVVGLMLAQQLSGISAVVAYSSLIFAASDSTMDPSICVIIIGVFQIFAGVLAVFLVDLAGRRLLMLVSTCGSVLFLGVMALYFHLQAIGTDTSFIYWLPVTAMIGFILFCTIGLGALPYVVLAEIFPCDVKACALMIANISGSLCSVLVTKSYQIVTDAYGIHTSFWGFAMLTVISTAFIYFSLPETKQRSLQEIQNKLHNIPHTEICLTKL